jgi:hypothetical protein
MILSSQSAPEKNVLSNRLQIPLRIPHPPSPHGSRRISLFPSYWSRSGNSSRGGGGDVEEGTLQTNAAVIFLPDQFQTAATKVWASFNNYYSLVSRIAICIVTQFLTNYVQVKR